ncbi:MULTISPECIES: hypothetical protein [unclassified Sutcliffiella]|jgi:Holliday junction resolvasome RuvABC DNA-binding subunit|uniref:hypothetical protein n=1 Tax=unclassified Sutcliffiella TaxID=2837532 RepID=UPI0030CBB891
MRIGEAISIATIALEKLGYSASDIEKITNKMVEVMDTSTVDQVEARADEIIYEDE